MFDFDLPTKLGLLVYYVGWIVTAAGLLALTLVLVWYFLTVIFSRVRGLGRLTEYAVWLACNKKEPCMHKVGLSAKIEALERGLSLKDSTIAAQDLSISVLREQLQHEKDGTISGAKYIRQLEQERHDLRLTLELYRGRYGAL